MFIRQPYRPFSADILSNIINIFKRKKATDDGYITIVNENIRVGSR